MSQENVEVVRHLYDETFNPTSSASEQHGTRLG